MDWMNTENIDTAFYTMKGLEELARAIPTDVRADMAGAIAGLFGLPAPADTSDQSIKRIFVFARMKLDTLVEQVAARNSFTQIVHSALCGVGAELTSAGAVAVEPKVGETGLVQGGVDHPRIMNEIQEPIRPAEVRRKAAPKAAPPMAALSRDIPDLSDDFAPAAPPSSVNVVPMRPARPASGRPGVSRPSTRSPVRFTPDASLRLGEPPWFEVRPVATGFSGLLLPYPRNASASEISGWLAGKPSDTASVAIAFPASPSNTEKVIEEEAEMSQGQAIYLNRIGASPAGEPDMHLERQLPNGGAAWLLNLQDVEAKKEDLLAFAQAVGRAVERIFPSRHKILLEQGAFLNFGQDAARMVTNAVMLQDRFLGDTDQDFEAVNAAPNHLGAISVNSGLTAGVAIDRAAYLLVFGQSLTDALVNGLSELRLAQVLRHIEADFGEQEASRSFFAFDQHFFSDCFNPLESYKVAKNVTMPELS